MFKSKNKKIRYTPVNPKFTILKWGVRGYSLYGLVCMMIQDSRFIDSRFIDNAISLSAHEHINIQTFITK